MDQPQSPEYRAVLKSGPALTRAIKFDLPNLTPKLLANGLISPHTEEVTRLPSLTDTEKANTVLADVRNQIDRNRDRYSLFFESLNSPDYEDGRKTLEEELQAARRELHSPVQVQSHDAGTIQAGNLHCGGTGTMTVMNAEDETEMSVDFVMLAADDQDSDKSDLIIRVASAFQTVSKLGSLAIMLEVEDWELQMRDLQSARLFLAKEATRKLSEIEIVEVLKQPALMALRSAEMLSLRLSEIWPSTSVCDHAPHPDAESIFQMSNIEKIGQRIDNCSRKKVLNLMANYSAHWVQIGDCLIGSSEVEKIKQESLLPGDEAAFMVEKWWKQTNSTQFSWKRLMEAIVRLAKRNYRHIGYDEVDSNTVNESDIEKVEEDILDLQDDLESIIVEVWDTMNERVKEKDFKAFRGRLRFGQYEPHIDKVFQDILVLPSVKNIDNFFDKIRPCINFVDIGLLIKLVNMRYLKFEPVKGKVYEYNKKMIDFRQTTVALVVKALMKSNLHPRKPEGQDYKLIVERLALDPYKCSLEHLNKLRTSHYEKLRELNLLEVSLMVFNNVEISSVVVTWLVKAEEAEFFERMFDHCISEGIFFDQNSIVDIRLNGRVFQTMEQALFQASYDDNARAVDTLLNTWNQAKHNLNKVNKERKTSLIVASELGHSGVVALLLEQEIVAIDYQVPGCLWTALFYAHAKGHMNTVKLLEEYGASKEHLDKEGRKVEAVSRVSYKHAHKKQSRHMGWGERLVSSISSLPLLKRIVKKSIHSLCEAGDYEEVKKIIKSGSTDVNLTEGKPFNWTPLMRACYGGHYNVVVLLLQHGADVHIKSSRDWTALLIAASQNHLRIANRLLREGAKPNDVIDPDELHHTALMYVSDKGDRGYVEMARALLKHGADVNIPDEKNSPPLLYAIQENDDKMVKLFLEYNADCNKQRMNGWCPLMECARTSASMCKLLVEHGAEMELAMKGAGKTSGDTSLHVACFYGEADIVKVLVEGGADINRENEMGLTPLMIATKQEHLDTVKSLAQFKSLDINHLHKETGVSAAILAASNGMIDICKVLLDHGAYPEVEGMKITDCVPKRLKKIFKELFQAYEVKNFPKPPVRQGPKGMPVTEQPTFGKLQKMKEEAPQSIPESKKHEETIESERQAPDLIGADSVQDEDTTSKNEDKRHVEESETKTLLQVERKAIAQAQAEGEGELPALEIQAEFQGQIEQASVSTQDIVEVSVVEGSPVILDSSVFPDSSVGKEIVEPDETKGAEEDEDDDSSLYGDEGGSSETDKHAVEGGGEKTKEADTIEVISRLKKMTLEERMKLMENIWRSYQSTVSDNYSDYIGTRNNKGVQQPQFPSSAQIEVSAL